MLSHIRVTNNPLAHTFSQRLLSQAFIRNESIPIQLSYRNYVLSVLDFFKKCEIRSEFPSHASLATYSRSKNIPKRKYARANGNCRSPLGEKGDNQSIGFLKTEANNQPFLKRLEAVIFIPPRFIEACGYTIVRQSQTLR